jgi:hypothetical protein
MSPPEAYMAEVSSLSIEYVEVPVSFVIAGAITNPTGDVVALAFTLPGIDPVSGDWVNGSWEPGGPPYIARTLVGPGNKVLAKGNYDVWVRVNDAPETPYKKAGFLKVT